MRWIARTLTALALAAMPSLALAQGAILQAGPNTPGHVPMYSGPGGNFGQTIVQDSGPAGGGATGLGLLEFLQVSRGTGNGPYPNSGTGPLATHNCNYDGPITSPSGYHYLCFDANAQGGGLIAYGAGGTASQLPLSINLNGTAYQFPFSVGGIVGPSPTVVGQLAAWANTNGTALLASASLPGVDTAVVLDYFPANVNSYLSTWEYGGAVGFEAPNAQALVGKIFCSPSWSTNMGGNAFTGCFGVAGYAIASNNGTHPTAGVGGYFQGSLYNPSAFNSSHVGQAWGLNSLVTNFPGQAGSGNIGALYSNIYSIEADVNVQPATTGATSLNGNARGIYITGTMDAQAGNMPGVEIDHNGTFPWKIGFLTDTGAATLGISLGAVATGSSQPSQALQFRSTDSGNATLSASIVEDENGYLFLNPGPSAIVVATDGNGTAVAKFSSAEATLSGVLGITPATWTDVHTCTAGQISVDASFIYVCTAANTVKRAAISAF